MNRKADASAVAVMVRITLEGRAAGASNREIRASIDKLVGLPPRVVTAYCRAHLPLRAPARVTRRRHEDGAA